MFINYFGEIDPLDCISENNQDRAVIAFLRKAGIDGFKLADIIYHEFNLRHQYEIQYGMERQKRDKEITRAIKAITSLCNNSLILDEEKDRFHEIKSQLINRQVSLPYIYGTDKKNVAYIKNNGSGLLILNSPRTYYLYKKTQNTLIAKSNKQVVGLQMATLFDYIQTFNVGVGKYQNNIIYGLIAALYKEFHTDGREYEIEKIKKLISNNKNIYEKLKASKDFLRFERDKYSMRQIKKIRLAAEGALKNSEASKEQFFYACRAMIELKETKLKVKETTLRLNKLKQKKINQ